MKKFKTTAKKQDLEHETLEALLGDNSLIHNALVRYTYVPLGIMTAGLMLVISWLTERPLLSWENALLIYQGIGGVALFYSVQAFMAFQAHKMRLKHARNAFIGSRLYPLLFAGFMLYLALPQGLLVLAASLGLFALLGLYHLRIQAQPLWRRPLLGSLIFTSYILLLTGLALWAPGGQPSLPAWGLAVLTAVCLGFLSFRFRPLLQLEKVEFVEKQRIEV